MFNRHLISALLAGVAMIAANSAVQACGVPCEAAPVAVPCYRTITVTEWVPETYETTRTVYKTEWKEEAYTTYKTECTPEVRTRTYTVNHMVTECRDEVRTVTKYVPTVEDRIITKQCWTTQQVTEIVHKTVDQGHYECQIVERKPTCMEKCKDRNKCCKPCYTTEKKVWCPCLVCIDCPVTKCIKVCTPVTECIKVTVCKPVCVQETFKVTCTKCVPECKTETYTVCVQHKVPYQATRTVSVCVPVCETYTACRKVCHMVEKEVCCENTCCRQSLRDRLSQPLSRRGL